MTSSMIIVGKKGAIGLITINRPEVRNALNREAWALLAQAFAALDADESVAVIVVIGSGEKAFVAGADLNTLKVRSAVQTFDGEIPAAVASIEQVTKPTIAAINGFAFGGGLELALACDIRICSKNAKLGQTEINVGILPGAGGTQRLSRMVGLAKAKELIFTGRAISADEAEKIGLVNRVVEHEELQKVVMDMAKEIAAKSLITLKVAKQVINLGANTDLAAGLALERMGQSFIFGTHDHLEGINAFLEKRKPEFKGY